MDEADYAKIAETQHMAASFANRPVQIEAAPGGRCAHCGEEIPPKRLATGVGTCIDCQLIIEKGML